MVFRDTNHVWFCRYLSIIYQVSYLTNTENIICGVPEGSILGSKLVPQCHFLFLFNSLNQLSSIIFADNLPSEHTTLHTSFDIGNQELLKMNDWFISYKISLNIRKVENQLFEREESIRGFWVSY